MTYDWTELAFSNKKEIKSLNAIFILAPREISVQRFTEICKEYLPQSNIVLGISKEEYILGFENQPQFRTLQVKEIETILEKIRTSKSPHKVYTLEYSQRDAVHVLTRLNFQKVLLVNGSWSKTFHTREEFYTIVKEKIPYDFISPFVDELEAKEYAQKFSQENLSNEINPNYKYSQLEIMNLLDHVARKSFDNAFQTGAILAKNGKILAHAHNKVVPFETYAMHYGAIREKELTPPHDTSHYDTIHAEVALMIQAQKKKIDLIDSELFINLLPCPSCARMFCETDINTIYYQHDHSEGYAVKLLEKAGKKVERKTL